MSSVKQYNYQNLIQQWFHNEFFQFSNIFMGFTKFCMYNIYNIVSILYNTTALLPLPIKS